MQNSTTTPTTGNNAARDFDFLMGSWHIRNTRLVRRLAGCTDWETFDATGTARPLPGGIGIAFFGSVGFRCRHDRYRSRTAQTLCFRVVPISIFSVIRGTYPRVLRIFGA